jgi:hypothetical protein
LQVIAKFVLSVNTVFSLFKGICMSAHLKRAVEIAAKALNGKDLGDPNWGLTEGIFHYQGVPVDLDSSPEMGLRIAKLLNPDHDTDALIAAEIEIAAILYNKRESEAKREMLRAKLSQPGAEATV